MMPILVPLVAAILPFALWPVELVFPFPAPLEELAKVGLVLVILGEGRRSVALSLLVASGVLFSFSETVLYSVSLLWAGEGTIFFVRLGLTTVLHAGTLILMWSVAQVDRRLLPVGLLAAIGLHAWYNATVSLAG